MKKKKRDLLLCSFHGEMSVVQMQCCVGINPVSSVIHKGWYRQKYGGGQWAGREQAGRATLISFALKVAGRSVMVQIQMVGKPILCIC